MADMKSSPKLPVRVAEGSSDGWRDLIVHVGGGMESHVGGRLLPAAGTYGAGERTGHRRRARHRPHPDPRPPRSDARVPVPAKPE
ncbi:MAG: hypothetical protein R2862_01070 [Thermoanaerobaculia bacterium]